jgi:hypothetical protein
MCSVPLSKGATVLDPWNGSGTTTYVADQLGFRGLGFDLNPVANLVANAKLARPRDASHVVGLAQRIAHDAARARPSAKRDDPLSGWLMPSTVAEYRRIEASVLDDLATDAIGSRASPSDGDLPPLASFLLLALMRTARAIAGVRTTTNPTWIVREIRTRARRRNLGPSWINTVEEMASDLTQSSSRGSAVSGSRVADATALPLQDGTVDFVLTSPPYCTRIDYIVSTSFELAALGVGRDSPEFDCLRRANMGTPLVRGREIPEPPKHWPREIKVLLSTIRGHASKASGSYYYKTYWQYFYDCERALLELHRTLRPNGAAVLVVQSSYYKELLVDLPKLYVALGRSLGFAGNTICQLEVRRALAQINTRSLAHRPTTSYHEAVIALEKTQ